MVFGNRILEQSNFQVTLELEEELHTKSPINLWQRAVFWVNPDAQFLYINDAACSLVGYSREELLSMTMHDVKPDFSKQDWSKYWKTIKQQGYLYFESLHWTKEGQSFPLEITFTYMEYNGNEYGCILVRDISQRKQASLALQRDNEAKKCKVQQQAVELSDAIQQLNREKALRQQAEITLEQEKQAEHLWHFVSMVSHEFRSPLNIISLSTSLLKRHHHCWTEEKKLQYLQRVQTAVENISLLMDEVLTIGRAEAGKLKFDPTPLNLIQFCREILTEMNLNESSQHKVTFVSQGDRQVCIDRKLLHPILRNLLSNAVKYSPIGSTIDLVLSYQDEKVIFLVKDWGIGIPYSDQQQLFKPFHRGGNVGNIPGNGLGLALVKKLVDLHNGQINVVSEVGVGTTFAIALPANQCKQKLLSRSDQIINNS